MAEPTGAGYPEARDEARDVAVRPARLPAPSYRGRAALARVPTGEAPIHRDSMPPTTGPGR